MMLIVIHLFRLMERGFSSLNGAVAAISMTNGKVLDVVAMGRHCQGCVNINALENNDELMKLKADHNCSITHRFCSGYGNEKDRKYSTAQKITV